MSNLDEEHVGHTEDYGPSSQLLYDLYSRQDTVHCVCLRDVHTDVDNDTIGLNYRLVQSKDISCTQANKVTQYGVVGHSYTVVHPHSMLLAH